MKKNQFAFTINRDTHLVVSINGNELKNQENFFSFFEQFFQKKFSVFTMKIIILNVS